LISRYHRFTQAYKSLDIYAVQCTGRTSIAGQILSAVMALVALVCLSGRPFSCLDFEA